MVTKIQPKNLNNIFRPREIIQVPESVSLATMLEKTTERLSTEKQEAQTRVLEQEIKIETMDKESMSENIANIVNSLFTEREDLNPIRADKKEDIDSPCENKQLPNEKRDTDCSSEDKKGSSNSSVAFEEWETQILQKVKKS